MHIRLTLVIGILFLSGCANQTMMRAHKSYAERVPMLKNVILLPPSVDVKLVSFGETVGRRQYNYEDQIERAVTETIIEFLRSKNYSSKVFARRDIHKMKASRNYSIFKDDFVYQMRTIYPTVYMDTEKAMDVNVLLRKTFNEVVSEPDKDFFLILEYNARIHSGSSQLAQALTAFAAPGAPVEDPERISIRATIIDAKNYRILWSNMVKEGYGLGASLSNLSSKDKVDRKRLPKLYKILFRSIPDKIGRD